jgi:hypothetical protein
VIGTTLCAGALLAAPCALTPVWAAPTVGRDEGGPQVQILAPAYQDTLKGRFRISVGIKATKFNPQSIEFFVDDRSATKGPVPIAAFPSMSFDWNTRDYADGPHKLTVRVTDTQGFRGWAEVNVYINNGRKVDSLPPTLVWKNIEQYQTLSGVAQVELDAVDNFGVKWLMVSINPVGRSGELATKAQPRQWLLNRPPYIAKFDTTAVPDGLYAFTAKAWDSTDQQGDAQPLTVGVVNNALNATSIEGMLNGLRADDVAMSPNRTPKTSDSRIASAAKPATETKPAPMGLLPEPEAVPGYGIFDDRAPVTNSGASAARASAPVANASSTKAAPSPAQTRRPCASDQRGFAQSRGDKKRAETASGRALRRRSGSIENASDRAFASTVAARSGGPRAGNSIARRRKPRSFVRRRRATGTFRYARCVERAERPTTRRSRNHGFGSSAHRAFGRRFACC